MSVEKNKVLWADLETRELIQQHKLNITPANFFSNIPSVAEVRESFEYREAKQQTGSYFSETIFSRERTDNFLTDLRGPFRLSQGNLNEFN